ncbi:MAG TPA: SCO family protein [Methylovirgula sp.]|nr:SCO family protein [Methylovirgula sp.]
MPAISRRLLLPFAILLLGFAGFGVAAYMLVSGFQQDQGVAIGGPFRLSSSNGGEVTDADFKGHPFLVFFGYTHCPDTCPTVLFQMSQVLKAMGSDKQIKALFITVDPERDTPAVMKQYLESFDPRIVGLSGTREEIDAVEKAYKVYAKKEPGKGADYAMDHTAIVYLMDKRGRFVNAFNLDRAPQVAAKDLDTYL